MKKIAIISDESIFCGHIKSGVAEVVDSLANALSSQYDVNVICKTGNSFFIQYAEYIKHTENYYLYRMLGVNYYLMLSKGNFIYSAASIVDEICPDIIHTFGYPYILNLINQRPSRAICTFDQVDAVSEKLDCLLKYDMVNTVSKEYAKEILDRNDTVSSTLSSIDFRGITNGILTSVFSPEKGLFIPMKYSYDAQFGKLFCKKKILDMYGINGNPSLYVMMCRLIYEKGIDEVIQHVHTIRDSGGFLIIAGLGDSKYEQQLKKLTRRDGVLWVQKRISPIQTIPMLAGADFYLSPSIHESCGLMPMTASLYGTIPIVTLNGGLKDNFNENNAIIVGENGLGGAIKEASQLYDNKNMLTEKRAQCMLCDFSWDTRKKEYIEVYES